MSGILEYFYIQYATNAKEAKKDTLDLGKAVDATEDKINKGSKSTKNAFTGIRSEVKETNEVTEKLALSFTKLTLAGVAALEGFAAVQSLKGGITNAIAYNAEIEKTTRLTGLNARELSLWDGAVQNAGGSAGEFTSWITAMGAQYQAAGLGDKIKNFIPNLRELSKTMHGLDDQSAFSLGAKFGIPQDVVLLLKQGPEALDAIIQKQAQLNNTTAETAAEGRAYTKALQNLETQGRSTFTTLMPLASGVLTIFKGLLWVVNDIVKSFTDLFNWEQKAGQSVGTKIHDWLFGPSAASPSGVSSSSPSGSTRGMRNNNPGNLRKWGGTASVDGYAHFLTLSQGLAAEQRQLGLYGERGINTLVAIASKWAPASENNLPAYIGALSKSTGFSPTSKLDLSDPLVRAKIANAINRQENNASFGSLISTAQGSIGQADQSALNALPSTSNSIRSVSVGAVNVYTDQKTADGISGAIDTSLLNHFRNTVGNADDGIRY